MKRKSPLRRTRPPSRSPMQKVNRKRRQSEFQRAYGSKARVAWVKQQPCVACGSRQDVENAHIETGGMGRKADYTLVVPLCHRDHALLHRVGRNTFEAQHWGGSLAEEAAWTERLWQRHLATRTA